MTFQPAAHDRRAAIRGDTVEVLWLDITEHHDLRASDEVSDVDATECVSWGILLDANDEVVKIIREKRGDTRDIQVFPKGCVKRITVLEPTESVSWNWCWNSAGGEGDDTV